jgi:hypothetical protein
MMVLQMPLPCFIKVCRTSESIAIINKSGKHGPMEIITFVVV